MLKVVNKTQQIVFFALYCIILALQVGARFHSDFTIRSSVCSELKVNNPRFTNLFFVIVRTVCDMAERRVRSVPRQRGDDSQGSGG